MWSHAFRVLVLLLSSLQRVLNASDGSTPINNRCHRGPLDINEYRHVHPPNVTGTWLSPRCEVIAGPRFVLRKYKFYADGIYDLGQYFYKDQTCTTPHMMFRVQGRLKQKWKALFLDEAYRMDNEIAVVSAKPYTSLAEQFLEQFMLAYCRQGDDDARVPKEEFKEYGGFYTLFDADRNRHCSLSKLPVALGELAILRQTLHTNGDIKLYTGKVPAVVNGRGFQSILPTAYQSSLWHHKNTARCHVCQCLLASSPSRPPQDCLPHIKPSPVAVQGLWESKTCESATNTFFAHRTMELKHDNSFQSKTKYFQDTKCKELAFSVQISGSYKLLTDREVPSSNLWNTRGYKLNIETVFAVTHAHSMTQSMRQGVTNSGERMPTFCGDVADWKQGIWYDLTDGRGCESLGVYIQQIAYILIKAEKPTGDGTVQDHLYLSEIQDRPHNQSTITQFEDALVRCDAYLQPQAPQEHVISPSNMASSICNQVLTSVLILNFKIVVHLLVF